MEVCSLIISFIKMIIDKVLGERFEIRKLKRSKRLENKDIKERIANQLQYLVELYFNALHLDTSSQETINSGIWESGFFIYETEYKKYLNNLELTSIEIQQLLSWFNQWNFISQKVDEYLEKNQCSRVVGYTILMKCSKQKECIDMLLPSIKKIIEKLNSEN